MNLLLYVGTCHIAQGYSNKRGHMIKAKWVELMKLMTGKPSAKRN